MIISMINIYIYIHIFENLFSYIHFLCFLTKHPSVISVYVLSCFVAVSITLLVLNPQKCVSNEMLKGLKDVRNDGSPSWNSPCSPM